MISEPNAEDEPIVPKIGRTTYVLLIFVAKDEFSNGKPVININHYMSVHK